MTGDRTPESQALRIGDLAARTGVSAEALRYYERRGLIRPERRRESGYREFSADAVRLVHFIKRAQSLGFSLGEIEELVRLRERAWIGDAPRQLRDAAVAKVGDIDRRMRQLRRLRQELAGMIAACDAACALAEEGGNELSADRTTVELPCPIIEGFDANDAAVNGDRLGRGGEQQQPDHRLNADDDPSIPGRRAVPRRQTPVLNSRSSSRRKP